MSQTLNINYDPYAPGTFALTFTINGVAPNLSTGYTATMRIWRSGLPTTAAPDATLSSGSAIALGTAGSIVLDLVVIHAALALVSSTAAVWTYDLIVTPTGSYSQKVCSGQLAEGVGSDQAADVTAPISVNWAGTVGGDLSGTLPNPEVDGLHGRAIVGTAPTDGEVYVWHAGNNHWRPEQIGTISIDDEAVTYAKLQHVSAASRLLGRGSASGSGDVEEITLGTGLSMSGTTLSSTGGGGVSDGDKGDITVSASGATWTIDNDAVTYGKLQNVSAASRILGRGSASGAGDVEEITIGTGLLMSGTSLTSLGNSVTIKEDTFTASGTFTKSANCKYVIVEMCGGGGGGGSGTVGGAAGAGGGGGMYWSGVIMSADLGTTTAVTIGAGGAAGVDGGATVLTNNTTSVILAQCNGGRTNSNSGFTEIGGTLANGFGSGGGANGNAGRHGGKGPGGGGGGHNASTAGSAGGRPCSMLMTGTAATGGGGAAGGTASGNGASASSANDVRGFGEGGGGAGGSGATVGNGGAGRRGSGGGGGGATASAAGTGGTGGDGFCRIIEVQVS